MDVTLAHGTGNDFVVVADLDGRADLSPALVRALCDRRGGLGADGVLRIAGPRGGADVVMDYRNADGGVVEMCGNGVRVVAKHVVDRGLVRATDDRLVIGTPAGDREVEVLRDDRGRVRAATVDMGAPRWDAASVPFDGPGEGRRVEVEVAGSTVALTAVSMGNPHAVIEVDAVGDAPVGSIGPALETHQRFPDRVNVGFAAVVDRATIDLRVWERGVGETAACGTGACAAAAVLRRAGRVDDDVTIRVTGGRLRIRTRDDGRLLMTGPAVTIADATLDDDWLAAVELADRAVAAARA